MHGKVQKVQSAKRVRRDIILSAEALAQGQPWCLALPTEESEVAALNELGFYSLPKAGSDRILSW